MRTGTIAFACLSLATSGASFAATVWLEDLDLSSASQGYGRPQMRRSITEKPISLKGRTYEHGVGAHAAFSLWIDLKGGATRFSSVVGVDDGAGDRGSVRFKVWADDRKAADSGLMKGGDAPKTLSVDLSGAKRLILLVTAGGDGIAYDHADWADARIEFTGPPPEPMAPPTEEPIILTPAPLLAPRVNGPLVYGVRPGRPFLYRIPATGERPMRFAAKDLPNGLTLNADTGIITGRLLKRRTYAVTLEARNARGVSTRPLRIVVGDTLALTPPMGWNSWYVLLDRVTDKDIRAAADAMVRTGMADHGYTYVNIDDCWAVRQGSDNPDFQGEPRDPQGRINANKRFPDMKALTDTIHRMGLKAGIYTSPGPTTCAGFTGSYGHEEDDARRFAEWGFDFLKYDWCSYTDVVKDVRLPGYKTPPPPDSLPHLQYPYRKMGDILRKLDRDLVYNLCQYGMGDVWEWGAKVGGNSWRTTGDLGATDNLWGSMSTIGFGQDGLERHAGPGHWNDPDYLLLGWITWQGKLAPAPLTPNEQYTYVSLWSLLSAPLFFSGDMTKLDDFTLSLLTNDEVIDVNLDALGRQAHRVATIDDDLEVWTKRLHDGTRAVGLFNRGEAPATITARWKDVGVKGPQIVRDLWRQKDLGEFEKEFSATVPRHGVVYVRVRPAG